MKKNKNSATKVVEIFFEKFLHRTMKKLAKIIEKNSAEIKNITLADEIIFEKVSDAKDWDINGEKISLQVEKI